MSVIACHAIWPSRRSIIAESDTTYDNAYRIHTNNAQDEMKTVIEQAQALFDHPQLYDVYVDANGNADPDAYCSRIELQVDQDDPYTWTSKCTFTTDISANPWLAPPSLDWGYETYQRFDRLQSWDIVGTTSRGAPIYKNIMTSAGEMFDPAPPVDDARYTLTVSGVRLFYAPQDFAPYYNKVNSGPFFGFPAETWKFKGVKAKTRNYGNIQIWDVDFSFEYRAETWRLNIFDMGYKQLITDPTDGTRRILVTMFDRSGHPYGTPQPLDGNGQQLIIDSTHPLSSQLITLTFKLYDTIDFQQLEIPGS